MRRLPSQIEGKTYIEYYMKKILILSLIAMSVSMVSAQDVDNFEVGPYEVEYKEPGDFKYRLIKGVDLYEYYHLKRDTVVNGKMSSPVSHALQVEARFRVPRYVGVGCSNVPEIAAAYKFQLSSGVYLNTGVSLALSFGKYERGNEQLSETLFMAGVPISLEFGKIDRAHASLYGTVGVMPTFYGGGKGYDATFAVPKVKDDIDPDAGKSGFIVAPQLGFGGYLPIGNQLVRLGSFFQYDINCSGGDFDVFKERIGRFSVGANIGLVF